MVHDLTIPKEEATANSNETLSIGVLLRSISKVQFFVNHVFKLQKSTIHYSYFHRKSRSSSKYLWIVSYFISRLVNISIFKINNYEQKQRIFSLFLITRDHKIPEVG